MFLGHFALGFGAKRVAPAVSLGTLFLACQLADLVWPNLVLLGIERVAIAPGLTAVTPLDFESYPYSHSLVALTGWAVLVAVAYVLFRGRSRRALAVIVALVLSHWVLDVISHRPDVPLAIGGATKLGLGLWYSKPATVIVEAALFMVGLAAYLRVTHPRDRIGAYGLWGLVAFLVLINVANMASPSPPPSIGAVAWSAQAMWLIVLWGYWVDRHRAS